jgi:NAD(P)-dependent dehydrogenase (short-subunit alcohol dehydrogenase family)
MSRVDRREFLQTLGAAAVLAAACRGGDGGRDQVDGGRPPPKEPGLLKGKNCLVTGATSGMGAVTALELSRLGATVIIAGRSAASCAARADAIRRETGARVETAVADLASQDQVRRLSSEVASKFDRLDVLVNNAGTVLFERAITADGLEKTFAVNYLSHFLLTNLLLDRLQASSSARIVNVSSSIHHDGKIEFDNLQGERHYERLDAYARSKLALLMFTYELSRRLEGTPVTANAVHPGLVASGLGSDNGLLRGWLRVRVRNLVKRSMLTPEAGARTIVYAASSPELEGVTGRYFDEGRDAPSSAASYDQAVARRLWDVSAELCALPRGGVAPGDSAQLGRR